MAKVLTTKVARMEKTKVNVAVAVIVANTVPPGEAARDTVARAVATLAHMNVGIVVRRDIDVVIVHAEIHKSEVATLTKTVTVTATDPVTMTVTDTVTVTVTAHLITVDVVMTGTVVTVMLASPKPGARSSATAKKVTAMMPGTTNIGA